MSDSQESLRVEYQALHAALDLVLRDLEEWLGSLCQELGIYAPRLEGRAKETHSYLLKVIRREREGRPYADPAREMTDKVGVRADLVYQRDVDRLVARIVADTAFLEPVSDADVDNKREALLAKGDDRVGYIGVHIDVVPKETHGLGRDLARCEVQVRTNAQGAWAMASHELVHKPPVSRTVQERRRINRLTTLLELFDEQVGEAQKAMIGAQGYPVAIVMDALQSARFRFLGTEYDRVLTHDIVAALVDSADPESAHELVQRINRYVVEREDDLRQVIGIGRPALVTQPEALLIFMLLDHDRYALQQAWAKAGFPNLLLDDLATAWDLHLPDPL